MTSSQNAALALAQSLLNQRPERARIQGWLDELAQGRGRIVALVGQEGVGKSRLVNDLFHPADGAATPTAIRVVEIDAGRSADPLAAIRELCEVLRRSVVGAAPNLADLLPPAEVTGDRDAGGAARRRSFDGIGELARAASRVRPLCVVIHDVDRGGPLVGELVAHLGESLFSADTPLVDRPALLLIAVGRELAASRADVERLEMPPLDRDAMRTLLGAPEVVDFFAAATQGRPAALVAMLAQLPTMMPSLFAARLERLSSDGLALGRLFALAERELSADDVARLWRLGGYESPLHATLDELEAVRLIERRIEEGLLWFRLAERAEQSTLLATLPADERRELHFLLAETIRARGGKPQSSATADLVEIAEHLFAAAAGEASVDAAIAAAHALSQGPAQSRAIELYRRAHDLTARDGLRAEIETRLYELQIHSGDYAGALESAEQLRRRHDGASERIRLGRAHLCRDEHALALAVLDGAAHLPASPAEASEIAALRAEALYLAGRGRDAALVAQSALGAGVPVDRALEIRNTLGKIHLAANRLDAAADCFSENLSAARQLGAPREECRARFNLGIVELGRGNRDAAEACYRDALTLAEATGDARNRAFCLQNLAVLSHWSSDFGSALRLFREAIAAFRQLGQRNRLGWLALDLASVHLDLGDVAQAEPLIALADRYRDAAPTATLDIDRAILRARLCLARGDLAAARPLVAEAAALAGRDGTRRVEVAAAAARLALDEGALATADEHLAAARAGTTLPPRLDALLSRLDGERRLAAQSPATAIEPLAHAARVYESIGDLDATWRTLVHLADAHHHDRPAWAPERKQRKLSPHVRRLVERADALWRRVADRLAPELAAAYRGLPERQRLDAWLAGSAPGDALPVSTPALAAPVAAPPLVAVPRSTRLVGEHPSLLAAFMLIDKVAPVETPVLIRGESGTGKELVADEIWVRSPRANKPIIKVNCGALVESLLLSELFGHEKGAFTGAVARKKGCFEAAHQGTLFLDEIGDISPKTQVALLRVLQEREVVRVGGNEPVKVDVRLVFATHRNLEEMVTRGQFREDLYYRLRGIQLELPALRERLSDLPLLCQSLLDKIAAERSAPRRELSADALELLASHRWPGNIRELDNTLRSVSLFADAEVIGADDLQRYSEVFRAPRAALRPTSTSPASFARLRDERLSLRELKTQIEIECITNALRETRGNITRAAEKLGMKRPRLSQLIKHHGLAAAVDPSAREELAKEEV